MRERPEGGNLQEYHFQGFSPRFDPLGWFICALREQGTFRLKSQVNEALVSGWQFQKTLNLPVTSQFIKNMSELSSLHCRRTKKWFILLGNRVE